jgi:hypothetical protein
MKGEGKRGRANHVYIYEFPGSDYDVLVLDIRMS